MTPKEQGRFCGSCEKIVVDFTSMSDKEMLDHISKTAGQSMCGRFANDQLNRRIEPVTNKRRFSLAYAWNLLLATVLFTESCSQESTVGKIAIEDEPKVEQHNGSTTGMPLVTEQEINKQPLSSNEIRGEIFDVDTGLPVEGARVHIQGSKRKAVTDSKGRFSLLSDIGNSVTLEVSANNFFTKTVQLNNKSDWMHVKVMINEEAFKMGEVMVVEDEAASKIIENCKNEKK
jgi:hypothetical protein